MKHSILLKFIAIVLCAASLLTLVGSGLGIWLMVELDLYDRTVEQFINDDYQSDAQYHAQMLAYRYAGRELGGLPEDFLENYYSSWFDHRFEDGGFGYAILDAEGNILASENENIQNTSHRLYSFPIEGNYMHMVSSEPVSQVEIEIREPGLGEGEYGIIDRVGEGTAPVYFIQISSSSGSEGIGSPRPLGFLERLDDGSIQFQANDTLEFQFSGDPEITHITFMDMDEQILYEVADEHPVAFLIADPEGGHSIQLLKEEETEYSLGNPAWRPVYQAVFYGTDPVNPVEILKGTQPIGAAKLDDGGNLDFRLYFESSKLKEANGIYSLVLVDQDGTVLFGEAQPQLRTATTDGVNFTSHPDALAVAMPTETAPEEAPAEQAAAPVEAGEGEADSQDAIAVETMPEETVPVETTIPTIPVETIPPAVPETVPETIPAPTEPVIINGKPLEEYDISVYDYYDNAAQQNMKAKVVYLAMPEYTVEIYIQDGADQNTHAYDLMRLLKQYSFLLVPALLCALTVLAMTTVYLCASAGHRKGGAIRAGGLNRMPLDLYAFLAGAAITGLGALVMVTCSDLLPRNLQVSLALIPLTSYGICLIFVGFCFALVAQCKTPGGYWWRNTLCGRVLFGGFGSLGKGMKWSHKKFFPWLWKVTCKFWDLCLLILGKCFGLLKFLWNKLSAVIKAICLWLLNLLRRFMAILPLTWQWMLGGAMLLFLGLLVWAHRRDGWGVLWLVIGFGLILYLSQCFGILHGAAKRMTKGDLETKIQDKRMIGCFQSFAVDLNNLADVVVVAAQKQLRSERMKTELITNVSHDIKTPLTSIINYVDLLQKPHTEEEDKEYLEVLDRQSQRLKKLIDDLMDMSKANTGNMHVEITRLDAVESVNQALGEFADKLERAELTPVFRHNTEEAFILADGKLVWRVLSNLLSNAVKYAMPGTRLYLDLMNLDGRVILSLKNISRDELNVDAEGLMERFVRGDDSRNTEGSGLGLNIAKSLMELQKGHLQLLVDGDLFKVTLVFPSAE